ncbi:MAG: O-antigen export protein [Parcubacteria bacterium C7867-003]|nr:MAG: O-antigen export protein [Parcubacteria bacterium C7867-003]
MNIPESLRNRATNGLRSLEPYTKTDMVYLASGGFWLGVGQFISSLSAFLTSIAFANLLSPDIFGTYKYIISISSLLTISTLSGMDSALTQAVSRGFDGTLNPAIKEKVKWGAVGAFISLVIGIYYYSQGNMTLAISFGIVALFMPFSESFDMYNSMLFGKKLFRVQTLYNSLKKIFSLVVVVLTIYLTRNIYIILFAFFSSVLIPNLFFMYRTKKYYQSNNSTDPEAIKYGKNLSAIYLMGLILAEVDKILIFHYIGPVKLAVYSLAMAPNDQIKGLLKNVNSLAMPQFSQKNPSEIKKTIWGKVKIIFIAITFIVLCYIFIAEPFFGTFFPKYLDSVKYSQVLSLSLIPIVMAGFLYTVLESQKATKELYQYNLYSNIVNLVILFPLIYFFGIWGAISSKLITRIFTFGLGVKLVNKLS